MSRLNGRRVFVTGGAGFIGRNLIEGLAAEGATVHATARTGGSAWRLRDLPADVVVHEVDLLDGGGLARAVDAAGADSVVHLAATGGHPSDAASRRRIIETAVVGTTNLLEALRRRPPRCLVNVGSSLEFGPSDEPLLETLPLRPTTDRGVAKAAQTLLCEWFDRTSDARVVTVRPFHVYGPWEGTHRLVAACIAASLKGSAITLGDPAPVRDPVFVDDVVEGVVRTLVVDAEGPVNLAGGRQVSNGELVEAILRATGRPVAVETGERAPSPADTRHWVGDTRRASALLGWAPTVGLDEGLARTVRWYASNLQRLAVAGR